MNYEQERAAAKLIADPMKRLFREHTFRTIRLHDGTIIDMKPRTKRPKGKTWPEEEFRRIFGK